MNCPSCPNEIEIQTDPKISDYVVVAGGSRKVETWDPQDSENFELKDPEKAKNLAENAFFKLEHDTKDKNIAKKNVPIITELLNIQEQNWANDYDASKLLRKRFREEKKEIEKEVKITNDLQKKASLNIPIVEESPSDVLTAKKIKFNSSDISRSSQQQQLAKIQVSSIFAPTSSSSSKDKSIMHSAVSKPTGTLLTKSRLKQDAKAVELALKKKVAGIDHRNFKLLDDGKNANNSSSIGKTGLGLNGLGIVLKKNKKENKEEDRKEQQQHEGENKIEEEDDKNEEHKNENGDGNEGEDEDEGTPKGKVISKVSSLVNY